MVEPTLAELKRSATRTPDIIRLEYLTLASYPDPYGKFVELVERALDWVGQELAKNPQHKQGLGEDQLTDQVVMMLRAMGFAASHEMEIGGHCDITVEGREEFLWLGEAKKHKQNYAWLLEGFNQLNKRYSTGSGNQTSGGIIVYCFDPRVDRVMEKWRAHLEKSVDQIVTADSEAMCCSFKSTHPHNRTGRDFNVRHLGVSLHFQPEDGGNLRTGGAARKNGQQAVAEIEAATQAGPSSDH